MTREELKQAILDQGFTLKDFAARLQVSYGTLRHALNGSHVLTPALQNHIMLALGLAGGESEAASGALVLAYKVESESGRVLAVESTAPTPAARANALASVIRYNLAELKRAGGEGALAEDVRALLGLGGAGAPVE